uniref:Uncharacterized protein n=1 Tax=Trichobilharzia regenti TaxID=157069 RepID=A0AA85IRN7_TRIRE|nr:unnamed protein product [Trichobilharzia regenti]
MSVNSPQIQYIEELLDRLFRGILSAKLEDLKVLSSTIPISGKISFADSKITHGEALYLFCRLERDYSSLQIFPNKSLFSRKDDCLTSYNSLRNGFDSVCNIPNSLNIQYEFAVHMQTLTAARGQLVTLYRNFTENPLFLITKCTTAIKSVSDILSRLSTIDGNVFTKAFSYISQIIKQEVIILRELISAQNAISDLMFLESLLCLDRAKTGIHEFNKLFVSQGVIPLGRQPAIVSWLEGFYANLLSKYTLYWFEILTRSVSGLHEIEATVKSENPDLVNSIIHFQQETNALNISLLFDTTCQSFAFLGHGYVLRGSVGDAPKGIGSIPPIFTAPLGSCLSPVDVYTIVMQINSTLHHGSDDENDNLNELLKQPRYVYDEKLSHTYYIKKIERRVYLALVYEGLKSPKDKSINEFISMLTETVCLHQVVNLLRQRQQTSASSSSSERNYLRSLFFH